MYIDKKGKCATFNGQKYTVGQLVRANEVSAYNGLLGVITEIRTGKDKETDNIGPDIYCDFERPRFPYEERVLKKMYGLSDEESLDFDSIPLEGTIMSPQMLDMLDVVEPDFGRVRIYVLIEEWSVRFDTGCKTYLFFEHEKARRELQYRAYRERAEGCIDGWLAMDEFIEEYREDAYSAYLNGEYCENHYDLSIKMIEVPITDSVLNSLNAVVTEALKKKGGEIV